MRVNRFLQSTRYPDIFGGGDCIYFEDQPLDKVGVYAVRQNPVLLHNISARLDGGDLMPFDPGGDYLLIFNLGGGVGVLKKRWLEFGGRAAFVIKDLYRPEIHERIPGHRVGANQYNNPRCVKITILLAYMSYVEDL
jgi:NADH dehydrogenase FAD-containing subunit